MSTYPFGSLLSNAGNRALKSALNAPSKNYNGTYTTNANVLANAKTTNPYTGQKCGFNMSIFSNGYYSASTGSSSYGNTSRYIQSPTGINRNAIANSGNPYMYPSASFGSSIIGNYYNSISSVVVGLDAPRSVMEQRLEYAGFGSTLGRGSMLGDYSNYFNIDSVYSNQTTNSNYNVFGTSSAKTSSAVDNIKKVAGANSVSEMMSYFA